MNIDPPLLPAVFLRRYKRFFADIRKPDGEELTLHCPNTGSMKNCLAEESRCWYSLSDNPKRKLPGTLEITTSPFGSLLGVNTLRANKLVEEGILNGTIKELQGYKTLRREVRYGEEKSRIDLLLESDDDSCYVEVKSVTLEDPDIKPGGAGSHPLYFPDAVTSRGTKHLRELVAMKQQGHRAVLFFCVQHNRPSSVSPAWHIDNKYCTTLQHAIEQGVEVFTYHCILSAEAITLSKQVPFSLNAS